MQHLNHVSIMRPKVHMLVKNEMSHISEVAQELALAICSGVNDRTEHGQVILEI